MNFSETNDTLHCSFTERLDGVVCSTIESELSRRATTFKNGRENSRLIFDLRNVIFISSAFLRLCLMHYKAFGKNGFSITNVSEEIHKVFHISGFAEIMHVTRADQAPELA